MQKSVKDISNQFLNVILINLARLEEHERRLCNGCEDLITLIKFANLDRNYIIVENVRLMITEFNITLSNVESLLDATKYKKFKKNLKYIENFASGKIIKEEKIITPFGTRYNHRTKIKTIVLHPIYFESLVKFLSDLRQELIAGLNHILFASDKLNKRTTHV